MLRVRVRHGGRGHDAALGSGAGGAPAGGALVAPHGAPADRLGAVHRVRLCVPGNIK